jgi:hypothetical protein
VSSVQAIGVSVQLHNRTESQPAELTQLVLNRALSEGKVLGENPVETYNTVTEVQSFGGQTSLVAHRGIVIRVGDVTALRSPS